MKQTFLLLAGAMLLIACHERKQATSEPVAAAIPETQDIAKQVKHLDELARQIDVPSQFFDVSAAKSSQVTGRKGTIIFICPADLESEAGSAPNEKIRVELKELSDRGEMARANAPTVSDGKLLVSGGAYFIKMTSGGGQLKLKKGRKLKVAFPKSTSDMELFFGERDSVGKMNWTPAKQRLFSSKSDEPQDTPSIVVYEERNYTMMAHSANDATYRSVLAKLDSLRKEMIAGRIARRAFINAQVYYEDSINKVRRNAVAKVNDAVYDIAEIRQMGWVNVDKFYKGEERTAVSYTIARTDSIACANIYLIFRDLNAMVSKSYVRALDSPTQSFYNIPVGKPVKLIAVGYRKDHLYASNIEITTAPDQHTHLVWRESTQGEVAKLFNVNE